MTVNVATANGAYEQAMRQAIALARRAAAAGDVPVGAVVLDDSGAIIGRGYNTRETHGDPLAHAEILAMREAAQYRARQNAVGDSAAVPGAAAGSMETDLVGCDAAAGAGAGSLAGSVAQTLPAASPARAWNLADCTLVVTLEPCPMCAGACIQTHIGTIVFGAWDAKLGACGSVWDIPRDPHIGHAPEVHGGILEGDCQAILTDFFAARR